MTRDEAVAEIQQGLGFTTQREDAIITQMKRIQRTLELGRSLPWFLKLQNESFTATIGDDVLALPESFLREVDREQFHFPDPTDDNEMIFLEKTTLEEGKRRFAGADAGTPAAYVMLGKSQVIIYPERDAEYTLTWSYYQSDEVLTSNIENLWLEHAPDVIIGGAGMFIAQDLRDQRAEQRFSQLYNAAWAGLFAETELLDVVNDDLIIGGRL